MQLQNGRLFVIIFLAAAVLLCVAGLTIFSGVDPSLADITTIR